MRLNSLLLAALAAAAAAPAAGAQTFSQLAPSVGLPGDTIVVHGNNLGTVTAVRFHAVVGGFVGQWTVDAPATVLSPTELEVVVPVIGNFTPPGANPPGEVNGVLELVTPAGVGGNKITFGFLEATFGQIETYGQGGSEVGSLDPRIGFRLQFGLPEAGNPSFDARGFDLPPGSQAFLAVGLPAPQPYLPFGGGELLLDVAGPLILFQGAIPPTQTIGETYAQFPIPASAAGATVGMQWVALDFTTFSIAVSNGLRATL